MTLRHPVPGADHRASRCPPPCGILRLARAGADDARGRPRTTLSLDGPLARACPSSCWRRSSRSRSRGVTHRRPGAPRGRGRPLAVAADYVRLTKPRIISLLLRHHGRRHVRRRRRACPTAGCSLWTMVGGYLAAGGANAINHYIDRDIDGRMAARRSGPWWPGGWRPARALAFGIGLGVLSALVLGHLRQLAGRRRSPCSGWRSTWASTRSGSSARRSTTSSSAAPPARCRRWWAGRP